MFHQVLDGSTLTNLTTSSPDGQFHASIFLTISTALKAYSMFSDLPHLVYRRAESLPKLGIVVGYRKMGSRK
ncbi:hypothetical protein PNOK_0963200 [Pyrrhoderma noxium]|uniref:Uncharacterized protein n=1 Tax=Pyrrhoderma noxium TaxID=2282107 RepID=A0A286U6C5_9AGAM|nr:hypothetical protein PNOK_0963200 [Pyrrhoderma noxium]